MSTFIRVFPLVPAPALYMSVGVLLRGAPVLPRAFASLALALGAAFAVTGLIGIFLPAAAATAGLSGLQLLWIIAAAIALPATIAHRRPAAATGSAAETTPRLT